MQNNAYVPNQGDLVWINMDPQVGNEIKGRRPALVVSQALFNKMTGFAVVCPVTTTNKRFAFHVEIKNAVEISGVIKTDQLKSIDFRARKIQKIETADKDVLNEVLRKIDAIIFNGS